MNPHHTPESVPERFAYALKQARADGLTYKEIAERVGVKPGTVENWALARSAPRDRLHWAKLAEVLDVTEAWLSHGDDNHDLRRLASAELVAKLSLRLADLEKLLAPVLAGEPIPQDPAALQALGRALGRKVQTHPPAASTDTAPGN